MSTARRDAVFQDVVYQAIRALGDGPVLPSGQFTQVVRNILYPCLRLKEEFPSNIMMDKLQAVIDKPLKFLNLDLPSAIDQQQRIDDLGVFIFGQVSAHFAQKRLVGEGRRSDRPQLAVGEF